MNFRNLTPEQRRELGSRGGRRAHAIGTAREWTSEEARQAGRKGNRSRQENQLARIAASMDATAKADAAQ